MVYNIILKVYYYFTTLDYITVFNSIITPQILFCMKVSK